MPDIRCGRNVDEPQPVSGLEALFRSVQERYVASHYDPLLALSTVIDLSRWTTSDEFEFHPIGSKAKRVYICPGGSIHPLLVKDHSYLFKVAEGWQAGQMWSEALAFQIGRCCDLDVPCCFVAYDPFRNECGALIEFFLGYPHEERAERLLHGADILQAKGFTAGSDRPHNVLTNIELCEEYGIEDAERWWARLVAFDTLIGNTDRHTQNWGLLADATGKHRMAPVFDNATSLGYQQSDSRLRSLRGDALDRFIGKGSHHMSGTLANESRTSHMELCRLLADLRPGSGAMMEDVIHCRRADIEAALDACRALRIEPAFTGERVSFVNALLARRREVARSVLRGAR
jgi:hypothetical protein